MCFYHGIVSWSTLSQWFQSQIEDEIRTIKIRKKLKQWQELKNYDWLNEIK